MIHTKCLSKTFIQISWWHESLFVYSTLSTHIDMVEHRGEHTIAAVGLYCVIMCTSSARRQKGPSIFWKQYPVRPFCIWTDDFLFLHSSTCTMLLDKCSFPWLVGRNDYIFAYFLPVSGLRMRICRDVIWPVRLQTSEGPREKINFQI